MALAFLIAAALWVLAWVVLVVLGLVNVIFKPLLGDDHDNERELSGDDPAA